MRRYLWSKCLGARRIIESKQGMGRNSYLYDCECSSKLQDVAWAYPYTWPKLCSPWPQEAPTTSFRPKTRLCHHPDHEHLWSAPHSTLALAWYEHSFSQSIPSGQRSRKVLERGLTYWVPPGVQRSFLLDKWCFACSRSLPPSSIEFCWQEMARRRQEVRPNYFRITNNLRSSQDHFEESGHCRATDDRLRPALAKTVPFIDSVGLEACQTVGMTLFGWNSVEIDRFWECKHATKRVD